MSAIKWIIGGVAVLAFAPGLVDAAGDAAADAVGTAIEESIDTTGDVAADAIVGGVKGIGGALSEHRIEPVPVPEAGPFEISPIPRSPTELFPGCRLVTFC